LHYGLNVIHIIIIISVRFYAVLFNRISLLQNLLRTSKTDFKNLQFGVHPTEYLLSAKTFPAVHPLENTQLLPKYVGLFSFLLVTVWHCTRICIRMCNIVKNTATVRCTQ
jgi:hypothetical protein